MWRPPAPIDIQDGPPLEQGAYVAAQAPTPATGFVANLNATRREMEMVGNVGARTNAMREAYAPLIGALHDAGDDVLGEQTVLGGRRVKTYLLNPYDVGETETANGYGVAVAGRGSMRDQLFARIRARRQADPNFLSGVPASWQEFEDGINKRDAAELGRIRSTQDRATGLGQVGGFVGGVIGSFRDPVNIATMPIGGASKTLMGGIARSALENMLVETISQPAIVGNYSELGEQMSLGDSVKQILFAGGAGGAFHAGAHGLGAGAKALADGRLSAAVFNAMPEPIRKRWANAATIDDRLLADTIRATVPESQWSPEQSAAMNVLERDADVAEASPFEATPAGDEAHGANMTAALQALIDGAPRKAAPKADLMSSAAPAAVNVPRRGVTVPRDIVDFFRGKGLSDAQANGIAAGIVAESRGDHTAINPTSGAYGLGQHLGSRQDELFRRYGRRPTRQQQLEFLYWELTGGDGGGRAVLRQGSASAVMRSYIEDFMRPAKGAETSGDLQRGMAALGEAGEPDATGGRFNDAAADEARADADYAATMADVDAERRGLDAEAAARAAARDPVEEVPILRREAFASDEDWLDAQVRLYRGEEIAAPGVPEAAPGRETASGPADGPEVASGAPARSQAPSGTNGEITVESYVDAYMRGEGRGDSARDLELLQFATNNGEAIEAEFARRATPPPMSLDEVEAARPATGTDPLWLLAQSNAFNRDAGKAPSAAWGIRDKETGELATWSVKRKPIEADYGEGRAYSPDRYEVELLQPEAIDRELRGRVAREQTAAAVELDKPSLERFDDPVGEGSREQSESLEHDLRAREADELSAETRIARNQARPRLTGLKGKAAVPIATFIQRDAPTKKGNRRRNYFKPVVDHPDHPAAKAGDVAAGFRLVRDLVQPEQLEQAARELKGATFVPVIAEEASGRNSIPINLAKHYAEAAAGEVEMRIVQAERAFHTAASPAERMVRRARYDGPVEAGRHYVLVDDVSTLGGTIAELADHIQRHGGVVDRVVLLASGSDDLAATPKQVSRIEEAGYGDIIREYAGVEPAALTRSEAQWTINARSPDRLRDRLAEAMGIRGERRNRPAAGGGESASLEPRKGHVALDLVGDKEPRVVPATLIGDLAVHRLGGDKRGSWTITHAPTGLQIPVHQFWRNVPISATRRDMLALARRMVEADREVWDQLRGQIGDDRRVTREGQASLLRIRDLMQALSEEDGAPVKASVREAQAPYDGRAADYRLIDESDGDRPLSEILDDLDAEAAAVEAMRGCLK